MKHKETAFSTRVLLVGALIIVSIWVVGCLFIIPLSMPGMSILGWPARDTLGMWSWIYSSMIVVGGLVLFLFLVLCTMESLTNGCKIK